MIETDKWYKVSDRFFQYYFYYYPQSEQYIGIEFNKDTKTWIVDFWQKSVIRWVEVDIVRQPPNFKNSYFIPMKRDVIKNIFENSEYIGIEP